ncbi:hypothetical protein [Alkaliphilus sp. B6464]|uniref:hypothetical protein n=1 Tax=Alkaliphilus sp. B6464 TaxID=2731219 RepID=UPI001BABDE0D|nr:hypothetical protein [Alkaliphilus sp. B6464]QUH21799.1 hypothetical protein HYG84_17845 [Alkaliphilus sp. B6464]
MFRKKDQYAKKNRNNTFKYYTKPNFPPLHKRKDKYSLFKAKVQKLINMFKI